MKFYIPELGDKVIVESDCEVTIYSEYRNQPLLTFLNKRIFRGFVIDASVADDINAYQKHIYGPAADFYIKHNIEKYLYEPINFFNPKKSAIEEQKNEYRRLLTVANKSYEEYVSQKLNSNSNIQSFKFTIPKNTELTIDRIYIRKGAKNYSSVTVFALFPGHPKKVRFWVKLDDFNKIHYI